jgi:DNA-binding response OmpR family regulator
MNQPIGRKQKKILVVDDDPNEMKSLVIGLKLEGFDALGAPSGNAAISQLADGAFSAILVDLMMPEMNGLQLARKVRASFPNIITILMSAYHLSPVQLARADSGVVGFVPKPFSFEELVRFIELKIDPSSSDGRVPAAMTNATGLHNPIDVSSMLTDRDTLTADPDSRLP